MCHDGGNLPFGECRVHARGDDGRARRRLGGRFSLTRVQVIFRCAGTRSTPLVTRQSARESSRDASAASAGCPSARLRRPGGKPAAGGGQPARRASPARASLERGGLATAGQQAARQRNKSNNAINSNDGH